jgi:uncharacterized protein involved in exopolysaccharide biosynthesis
MDNTMDSRQPELTYSDLLRIVRGSWLAIVVWVAVGGVAGAVVAFMSTPAYRAEVLLAPATTDTNGASTLSRLADQLAPLSGLVGGDSSSGGLTSPAARIATLRSRHLTESFIRDRNLLPVLFPEEWDAERKSWRVSGGSPQMPTLEQAFKLFDEEIRGVSEDRRSGLVTLSVEWRDREAAASWANDLVARVNEYLRTRAISEAQRSIAFLEAELKKTGVVERQQIIYRLVESKTSEIMMANARKEFAFVIVDPAVPADLGNYVRPRRVLLIGLGLILGLLAGAAYASIRWMRAPAT